MREATFPAPRRPSPPWADRAVPLGLYRFAVVVVAGWSLVATTLVVWILARGGVTAAVDLLRSPGQLFTGPALLAWLFGAVGAFAVLLAAFLLSQAVGRGLLRLLEPRPLSWPAALPVPDVPVRLLAFRSAAADAFTFALLVPSVRGPWRREEVILVSEGLLAGLSPDEWEAVVAHELAHVRRLDGRYLTFLRTFARLMRWDPILAAVASRLTRREEFQADAEAVAMTRRPRALARAIFKAASLGPSRPGALAGLLGPGGPRGRRQAFERIRRLVELADTGAYGEEDVA